MAKKDFDDFVERIVLELPKVVSSVKLPVFRVEKQKDAKNDEEVFVLLLSDLQIGHLTKTFNVSVFRKRMKALISGVLRVTDIHRKSHPVKKLVIFMLGDNIQSERAGFLVDLDELEIVLKKQVFGVAIPAITGMITEFAKHFNKVEIHTVRGNHGSCGKFASKSTNWDDVIYEFLKLKFAGNRNVRVSISNHFYKFVDVLGHRFLLTHGDKIKMYMNIPIAISYVGLKGSYMLETQCI